MISLACGEQQDRSGPLKTSSKYLLIIHFPIDALISAISSKWLLGYIFNALQQQATSGFRFESPAMTWQWTGSLHSRVVTYVRRPSSFRPFLCECSAQKKTIGLHKSHIKLFETFIYQYSNLQTRKLIVISASNYADQPDCLREYAMKTISETGVELR
jgi:hypothetical protein